MKNSLSLEILSDKVSKEIRGGKDFRQAFFFCFPTSSFFEHEQEIVMSKVGKILSERKQMKKERIIKNKISILLAGSQEMLEQGNEDWCPPR